ncbi:nitroreductase family protein [Candidatus Pacearchaeota archaeon]|nr:nitroreductase family protein [Candidatus Pacearchaeota archaeon]
MKPYDTKNERKPDYDVDKIFIDRWSPRSLSPDLSEKELMSLFEAARWSPSSSNGEPWRFLYAKNESKEWDIFYDLLTDFNKIWCKNAAYLIVLLSRKNFQPDDKGNEKTDRHHSFGAGTAWMALALQARIKGWIAHGMAGFDIEKAKKNLGIPENYHINCMIAVGKQGEIEKSIPERMQKSEKPNERKKVKDIVYEGRFPRDKWK